MSSEPSPADTAFWDRVDACLDARVDVWGDDAIADGLLQDPTRIAALEALTARLNALETSAPVRRRRWWRAAALVAVGGAAAALALTLKSGRQDHAAPPPPAPPAAPATVVPPPHAAPAVTVLAWHITSTRTSLTSTSWADVAADGTQSTTDTEAITTAGLTARITQSRQGVAKP